MAKSKTVHFSVRGMVSICFTRLTWRSEHTMRIEGVTCKKCLEALGRDALNSDDYGYGNSMSGLHAYALRLNDERKEEAREAFERALLLDAAHAMALDEAADRSAEAEPCAPFRQSHGCGCCRHYGPCVDPHHGDSEDECLEQACTQCGDDDED